MKLYKIYNSISELYSEIVDEQAAGVAGNFVVKRMHNGKFAVLETQGKKVKPIKIIDDKYRAKKYAQICCENQW
jgi:hypothetical protein